MKQREKLICYENRSLLDENYKEIAMKNVRALLQGFSGIFLILVTKINSQDLPQYADRIWL